MTSSSMGSRSNRIAPRVANVLAVALIAATKPRRSSHSSATWLAARVQVRRGAEERLRAAREPGAVALRGSRERALHGDQLATRVAALGQEVGVDQARGVVTRIREDGREQTLARRRRAARGAALGRGLAAADRHGDAIGRGARGPLARALDVLREVLVPRADRLPDPAGRRAVGAAVADADDDVRRARRAHCQTQGRAALRERLAAAMANRDAVRIRDGVVDRAEHVVERHQEGAPAAVRLGDELGDLGGQVGVERRRHRRTTWASTLSGQVSLASHGSKPACLMAASIGLVTCFGAPSVVSYETKMLSFDGSMPSS
jgi:hypothetical protein